MIKTACFLFLTPFLIPLLQVCVLKGNIILSSFQLLNSSFSSDVIFYFTEYERLWGDHSCRGRMLLIEKWSTFSLPRCTNSVKRYGIHAMLVMQYTDFWHGGQAPTSMWAWLAQLLLNTPVSKCTQHIKWLSFCVSPTKTRLSKGTQIC